MPRQDPAHARYQGAEPHARVLRIAGTVAARNGLLESAYFIGAKEARAYFKGKSRISVDRDELQKRLDAGEEVSRFYFLFEHGTTLDEKGMALAKRAGIPAVVSINEFHYAGRDHMQAAHADVERLLRAGLIYFQIDSTYDIWLR